MLFGKKRTIFAVNLRIIMEITGKIIAVLPERGGTSKTGNEWKMQEYVLETHEQYPRKVCFNVFGADKIAQFNIQAGDELTVSFDINAREYNGRWYLDVNVRDIRPERQAPAPASVEEPSNDLPFSWKRRKRRSKRPRSRPSGCFWRKKTNSNHGKTSCFCVRR